MLPRCVACSPDVFATKYWGRQPLLSRSSALPRDFDDLLSTGDVDELIAERGVRAPFIRLARDGELLARSCYLGPAGFGAEVADQVDSAKVLSEFASGATIVLQGLHRLWPPLITFVRQAVDDLGHPVQANAYVTPPGNRGFDPHYDVHDVFVVQTAGHKRWIVHEPVHRHPLSTQPWTDHRQEIAERTAAEPVLDTVLEAGDVLYLPRGWVHAAQALETTSIHLTLGVSPVTRLDVVRAIVEELADLEEFRESLPISGEPPDRGESIATVTKVMAQMVDALRDDASALSGGAAARLAERHAHRTRPAPVRPLASFGAAQTADTAAVRWRQGLMATIDQSGNHVAVRLPDRVITFPASCAEAVRALHRGAVFDVQTLPGLDRADSAVVISRLLREAVVAPVNDCPPVARA